MSKDIWYYYIEFPEGSFGDDYNTEVVHFSNEEVCVSSLLAYLEEILEKTFSSIDDAFAECIVQGFKVYYAPVCVKK